jgi:hypothetical protein
MGTPSWSNSNFCRAGPLDAIIAADVIQARAPNIFVTETN